LLSKGKYYVYAWWQDLANAATNAKYQIFADGMYWNKIVNQRTNGGKWVLLDSIILNSSSNISIKLSNQGDGTIIADAIKIEYVGLPTKTEREMFADDFQLYQNFPNPFNQSTIIRFFINKNVSNKSITDEIVSFKIYDILGKELLTMNEEPKSAGIYEVEFSGKDKFGNPLPSGIYFCTMQVGNRTKTIKMSLVK
ncbi:MAG: T9SS type A sorting domain-containing protein, partial [Ignavibacteria bacterium]|nr:T9SS type A sorting domain-containing protein [Ignavibacteria bacterium]